MTPLPENTPLAAEPEKAVAVSAVPIQALLVGPEPLARALAAGGPEPIECEHVAETVDAPERIRALSPDVIVVDGDRRGARELCESLLVDPATALTPLIVLGSFDSAEAAGRYAALGASRVLPRPVPPDTLRAALLEVCERATSRRAAHEPIGDVTVDELCERLTAELRRGLSGALLRPGGDASVPCGDGHDVLSAVWSAVARVRELCTMRSGGSVRFEPSGPEGAIALVPWTAGQRRASERGPGGRVSASVPLVGRRMLIVDDDPAVVWFLSEILREVGAEVIEAHDGLRALSLARQYLPDVIISDVVMPGIDGLELCRRVQSDVVLCDVPVVLLSWKEDLLQHLRELGVNAAGELRKEAKASTVVQRLKETLRPRARVEARLDTAGEARGRLDDVTPRLILQLLADRGRNVRLSVRDAAHLYEVELRGGQPVSATRTASDGSFERGVKALTALLGVRSGRFAVTPNTEIGVRELHGELGELLAAPIERARAALRSLALDRLDGVERIELDAALLADYLALTPEPVRGWMSRLIAGAAPAELFREAGHGKALLANALADAARRGAVLSVAPELPDDVPPPRGVRVAATVAALGTEPAPGAAAANDDVLFHFAMSPVPARILDEPPCLPLSRTPTPCPAYATQNPDALPRFAGPLSVPEPTTLPGIGAAVVAPVTDDLPPPNPPREAAMAELHARSQAALPSNLVVKRVVMPPRNRPAVTTPPGASGAPECAPSPLSSDSPAPFVLDERSDKSPPAAFASDAPPAARPLAPQARPIGFPRSSSAASSTPRKPMAERLRKLRTALGSSAARSGLLVALAAGLSFAAVRWLVAPDAEPASAALSAPAPLDPSTLATAALSAAARPAAKKVSLVASDMDLPAGINVATGLGLLEVDSGGAHSVYVDGEFVGRGPLRRVPTSPGKHTLRLDLAGDTAETGVEITQGRRSHVVFGQ